VRIVKKEFGKDIILFCIIEMESIGKKKVVDLVKVEEEVDGIVMNVQKND